MSHYRKINRNRRRQSVGRRWFRFGWLSAFLLALLAISATSSVQASTDIEYRVKTAFIYNFTKFIEWPPIPDSNQTGRDFHIGILGANPFQDNMNTIIGKPVGNRTVSVKHFRKWDDNIRYCDILYISESEEQQLPEILKRLRNLPVLTVGDTVSYAERGVMINFRNEDNKVRFEINLLAADQAGIKLSSRIIKLAREIFQ